MKYIVSIDWLSFSVHGDINVDMFNVEQGSTMQMTMLRNCEVKKLPYNNRQFSELYEVYYCGVLFAVVQAKPFAEILDKNLMIVKLANYWLYRPNGVATFYDFIRLCGWTVHNVSRVDICADFERFECDECPEFIRKFAAGIYRHVGRAKGVLHFRKKGIGILQYNGLRFGTAESERSVYLYNKTLELEEVKDKPYIRDKWKAAGLTGTVWRLEVSIKSGGMEYVERETGEDVHITQGLLTNMGQVERVYMALVGKYFQFITYRDGITNVTREPRIRLFGESIKMKLWNVRNVRGGTKADKIAIKRVYQSSRRNTIGELATEPTFTIQMAAEMAASANLQHWYEEHAAQWEDEEIARETI